LHPKFGCEINQVERYDRRNLFQILKFTIDKRKATFACHDRREVAAMSTGIDPNTALEIVRAIASLGLFTSVAVVLAWQSPKLLEVFLAFVRNLIKDFRTSPKPPKPPKPPKVPQVGGQT
jgi:hypothetical protein